MLGIVLLIAIPIGRRLLALGACTLLVAMLTDRYFERPPLP